MSISDLQIDTSLALSENYDLSLYKAKDRQPFSQLVEFIELALKPHKVSTHSLEDNAHYLRQLCAASHNSSNSDAPINFTKHHIYEEDTRYYEQIIFETKEVPTRPNWHDFFNGVIWCQFPKTKHTFNALHMSEIALQGNTNRTPVRDKLTHFDECGIVLFTTKKDLAVQLKNHQWQDLFVKNSANWHQQTLPIIFGHALWEMLLTPFIGLTAKATVIEVSNEVMSTLQATIYSSEFYAVCDNMLNDHIEHQQLITTKKPWLPLPLLGIPEWSPFEQTHAFYDNKKYFMPKR